MFDRDTYGRVREDMERRRREAVDTAERRNAELRLLSPDIKKIDAELQKTGLELFRLAVAGESIDALRKRNQELCARRKDILKKLGYPEDYTEPKYRCPLCADTGFVGTEMCRCFREELIRENIRTSGIGALIDRQTFDNFDVESYRKDGDSVYSEMKRNFEKAKLYAENFGRMRGNILMMGKTGTGKTHLSTAMAGKIIAAGYSVLYDSAQNIMNVFEDDRFRSTRGEEPKSEKFLSVDLLILDDLGTEFINSFTLSCLYNLINTRQNRGLATVISTNLSPTRLTEQYEDRIYSRIIGADYDIWRFEGHDHRIG